MPIFVNAVDLDQIVVRRFEVSEVPDLSRLESQAPVLVSARTFALDQIAPLLVIRDSGTRSE